MLQTPAMKRLVASHFHQKSFEALCYKEIAKKWSSGTALTENSLLE